MNVTQEEVLDAYCDEALLEKINEMVVILPKRPKGFGVTVTEFIRDKDISEKKGRDLLNELVKSGKLKKKQMREGRSKPMVYYEPEKK